MAMTRCKITEHSVQSLMCSLLKCDANHGSYKFDYPEGIGSSAQAQHHIITSFRLCNYMFFGVIPYVPDGKQGLFKLE